MAELLRVNPSTAGSFNDRLMAKLAKRYVLIVHLGFDQQCKGIGGRFCADTDAEH